MMMYCLPFASPNTGTLPPFADDGIARPVREPPFSRLFLTSDHNLYFPMSSCPVNTDLHTGHRGSPHCHISPVHRRFSNHPVASLYITGVPNSPLRRICPIVKADSPSPESAACPSNPIPFPISCGHPCPSGIYGPDWLWLWGIYLQYSLEERLPCRYHALQPSLRVIYGNGVDSIYESLCSRTVIP